MTSAKLFYFLNPSPPFAGKLCSVLIIKKCEEFIPHGRTRVFLVPHGAPRRLARHNIKPRARDKGWLSAYMRMATKDTLVAIACSMNKSPFSAFVADPDPDLSSVFAASTLYSYLCSCSYTTLLITVLASSKWKFITKWAFVNDNARQGLTGCSLFFTLGSGNRALSRCCRLRSLSLSLSLSPPFLLGRGRPPKSQKTLCSSIPRISPSKSFIKSLALYGEMSLN